ncbi:aconitate hydratase, partial [bacterium B13(2017)]
MAFDFNMIQNVLKGFAQKIDQARKLHGKPLTLTEKILYSHLKVLPSNVPIRGETYVNLCPDRVAMQDATAQMALLQFMQAGKEQAEVPASIHCDHLIPAEYGAQKDVTNAKELNKEVYEFLESVGKKYGIGFWKPGTGIIHQIVFENYAFPGGLMIGTDSHTPNAGGLSMLGIGVGGADAVDVLVGMPWELKWPKIIGVKLNGKLKGWASPKDVILKLAGILTVKGGTGAIIEYFGNGVKNISTTGKSTITNMGAEVGATTSVFPFDEKSFEYLMSTNREDVANLSKNNTIHLQADNEVFCEPEKYYDQIIEINLDELEPHLVGPYTPDLDRTVSSFKKEIQEKNYPTELKVGLIGSCTNSSYEDLHRVASIIENATENGLKAKSLFYISPGSEQIRETIKRDGILQILENFGAIVLSNSCGPCIGQWIRTDFKQEIPNTILTSFNRNFKARNDGNPSTLAFITSPELITAMVIAGRIDFNPMEDTLGENIKLLEPKGDELPKNGFVKVEDIFSPPSGSNPDIEINIPSDSKRLQELKPFEKWNKKDSIDNCQLLAKTLGKCTTDHISPAGKWLRFRGHLDNISNNMFSGATNAFTKEIGQGFNQITKEKNQSFSDIARFYLNQSKGWVV